MLTVEVVVEDEIQNNLGFLALETFPHYHPDFNDNFTYEHQLHQQKKDMKMPKETRKQKSSFWNLSFIYKTDWRRQHHLRLKDMKMPI